MCHSRLNTTRAIWASYAIGLLTGLLIALFLWLVTGMPNASDTSRAERRRIELLARKVEAKEQLQAAASERLRRAREAEYRRNIEEFGDSSEMMRWSLRFLQGHMREQDGPQAGRFIAPSRSHHVLLAELDAKLRSTSPYPRCAGMMFREFGKSTYGTLGLTLYSALECGKCNIAIIAASKQKAKESIANIIHELETNELLRKAYGEAIDPATDRKKHTVGYTDFEIKIKGLQRADGTRQMITIKAFEFGKGKIRGGNVSGKRFDLIIFDDPETDDLTYSEILRQRYWDWVQRATLRSLSKYGLLVWLGTPVGEHSLLMLARARKCDDTPEGMGIRGPLQPICDQIIQPDGEVVEIADLLREHPDKALPLVIEVLKRPEIQEISEIIKEHPDDAQERVNELLSRPGMTRLVPHWRQRHSEFDVWAMLAEMTPEAGAQELFLLPSSILSNPWDVAWLLDRTYDNALLHCVKPGTWEYDGKPLSKPIAWIDSAGSTDTKADYTAIGVAAKLPSGRGILLDLVHGKFTLPQQEDHLRDLNRVYGLAKIYHQPSQFEKGISQYAGAAIDRDWLPFEEVKMNTTAGAKIRLISESTTPVRNGAMLYCFTGERGNQRRLITEIKTFPGGKVDALDMHANLIKVLNNPDFGAPPPPGQIARSSGRRRESVSRDMERF